MAPHTRLITDFATGPASASSANSLANVPQPELEALVKDLVEAHALLHLEALSNAPALPKPARKAARVALYQLRSQGVELPLQSHTATLGAPPPIDLQRCALAVAPGLYGRFWLLLGPLPGVSAIEIKGETHGTLASVEAVAGVGASRLEKLLKTFGEHGVQGHPFMASADLALRLLQHLEALIRLPGHPTATGLPASWAHVLLWRDRALALGADPARADARARLPVRDDAEVERAARDSAALFTVAASGPHVPPPWIVEAVLSDVLDRADTAFTTGEAPDPGSHAPLLAEIALAHADAFLRQAVHAERCARSLEASADALHHLGQPTDSAGFFALADTLRRLAGTSSPALAPRELGLVAQAFLQLVDTEQLARARGRTV